MNHTEHAQAVRSAEKAIESLLTSLESHLGKSIASAELVSIDITKLSDAKPARLRIFRIEMADFEAIL